MKNRRFYKFLYILARPLAAIFMPYRVYGRENIPDGAAIICPNHSHILDPILVSLAMGFNHFCRHVSKAEAKKNPVYKWLLDTAGSIYVRRGEADIESYKTCIRTLKAGEKLMIFPEGTRVHGDSVVEPKSGVIRMAARSGAPIVPVYIPRDRKLFRRYPIVFGEPYTIEKAGHEDYDPMARELMDRIWALKREE